MKSEFSVFSQLSLSYKTKNPVNYYFLYKKINSGKSYLTENSLYDSFYVYYSMSFSLLLVYLQENTNSNGRLREIKT